MPCACQPPVPNYPENALWGPVIWQVLHGLAEKAGQASIPADEIREWQKFIQLTGEMLPCEHCRDHYARYTLKHPLTQISTIPYSGLKTFVKTWFFNLHNEVDLTLAKPTLTYEELAGIYGNVDFKDLFWRLDPILRKAIQLSGVSLMKWTKWVHSFKMLRAILGV